MNQRTRIPTWRVRVKRFMDDWIDVQANTPEEAEIAAASKPFILAVYSKSAIPGERSLFREQLTARDE